MLQTMLALILNTATRPKDSIKTITGQVNNNDVDNAILKITT